MGPAQQEIQGTDAHWHRPKEAGNEIQNVREPTGQMAKSLQQINYERNKKGETPE